MYFFFAETARLSLEETAKNFGEEVAIHVTDATDEEKVQLERNLARRESTSPGSENWPEVEKETPKADN
jgi:hypothetical protein